MAVASPLRIGRDDLGGLGRTGAPAVVQASLSSVTGISPTSVWAVGSQPGADTAHPRGLVMHGDGTTWTEVAVPAPAVPAGGSWQLSHVTSTAGQVWAVGTTTSADSASQHSFVLHFDGATWSVATLPDLGPAYSYDTLYGIAAASPTSVWVTGSASTGNQRSVTFAEHYDGAGWTLTPTPSPAPSSGLAAVATNGATTWSVGSTTTSSGAFQTSSNASPLPAHPSPRRCCGLGSRGGSRPLDQGITASRPSAPLPAR